MNNTDHCHQKHHTGKREDISPKFDVGYCHVHVWWWKVNPKRVLIKGTIFRLLDCTLAQLQILSTCTYTKQFYIAGWPLKPLLWTCYLVS